MFIATFFIIQLVMKYVNKVVKTQFQFPKMHFAFFYKQFGTTRKAQSGRLRFSIGWLQTHTHTHSVE